MKYKDKLYIIKTHIPLIVILCIMLRILIYILNFGNID